MPQGTVKWASDLCSEPRAFADSKRGAFKTLHCPSPRGPPHQEACGGCCWLSHRAVGLLPNFGPIAAASGSSARIRMTGSPLAAPFAQYGALRCDSLPGCALTAVRASRGVAGWRYCFSSEALALILNTPWVPLLSTIEILSPALAEMTSIVSEQETSVLVTATKEQARFVAVLLTQTATVI
jgi:hypothetical protein